MPRSHLRVRRVLCLILVLTLGLVATFVPGGDGARFAPPSPVADMASTDTAPAPMLVGRGGSPLSPTAPRIADAASDEGGRPVASDADDPAAAPAPMQPSEDEDESDDHLCDGLALTERHPLVASVIAVQERQTRDLLRNPLVVGTATGMNERGEICVVVLTKVEVDGLPSYLDGAPVMQYVTGEFLSSKGKPPGSGGGGGGSGVDPTAGFARPVPIGVSTGHPSITAGTIGCRVTDGMTVFALSNNHVYASENLATIGDSLIQPGGYDGGISPADDIGNLHSFVWLKFDGSPNTVDAAIASSTQALLGNATPSDGYGTPRTTTLSPAINLRVQKYGRTTGQTAGKVFAINASVSVGYSTGTAFFVDQVVVTPGAFSAGGDSGSLIVGEKGGDARRPVALLFAGSSSATIATPIDTVLDAFGVSVDGE